MIRSLFVLTFACLLLGTGVAQNPAVRVAPSQVQGSRPLEKDTERSVVRDYLKAWTALDEAISHNDASALNEDFIGVALDRLKDTVNEQIRSGVHTSYTAQSHDLQIVFYSPEGLSIQLSDSVQYEQKLYDKDKVIAMVLVRQRYLVVMTPAESRWQVRVFQAAAE